MYGNTPLNYNGDVFVKFVQARITSRTGGGFNVYPNKVLAEYNPTMNIIYLNCASGVNFGTTSLDASLDIEYITRE